VPGRPRPAGRARRPSSPREHPPAVTVPGLPPRKTILLLSRLPARWLLFLLQLLLLLLVFLLQLLRLLLMALFHLLPLRFAHLLFIQLHVLLVLLLLEFVSLLLLFRNLLFLLLLVLFVQLRVARIWSAPSQRRKLVRMNRRAGSSPIGWCIRPSCLFGRDSGTVIKISGPWGRCGAGLAHVRRRALLRVGSGCLRMLRLSRYRWDMSLPRRRLVFRPWTRADSTIAAVVTITSATAGAAETSQAEASSAAAAGQTDSTVVAEDRT